MIEKRVPITGYEGLYEITETEESSVSKEMNLKRDVMMNMVFTL